MTRKFFGTDGIRGLSNTAPMDAETALRVGMAAGAYFKKAVKNGNRPRVIIGKDTRLSGYLIEPALTSGFISMGMDVVLVGPMPTPAISLLTQSLRADLGVMISASHNPYHDNGIKLFAPNGLKLSDKVEIEIEKLMENDISESLAKPEDLGRARRLDDAPGRYIEYIKQTLDKNIRLDGLKIVVDCANGAAYKLAPTILWELGAEIIALGVEPNGCNINNECGSTYTNHLRAKVIEQEADIGISLDGDADRLIICDEKGAIIDGDQIMGTIAEHWHKQGKLNNNTIVTTYMSNLGLEKHLESVGIKMIRTQVGDRYVIEEMIQGGYNLGGEQSGHIIFKDYMTTGDGILAALQILSIMIEKQDPASITLKCFENLPQILHNVSYDKKSPDPLKNQKVKDTIKKAELEIKNTGRVFIRKSGTEPLIRIMIEGNDHNHIEEIALSIASVIESL